MMKKRCRQGRRFQWRWNVWVLWLLCLPGIVGAEPRPNVVLIVMDDLGWRDLGVSGSEFYETPHIDRMAEEGMQFTRAYAAGPLCAPSRGAILSGKYPARTKFTSVVSNAPDDELYAQSKALGMGNAYLEAPHRQNLPLTETLFAERFRAAGYQTCFIGKWHCGRQPGYHPADRGYEEVYAVRRAGGYPYYLSQAEIDNLEGVPGAEPGDYLPEKMTEFATDFIERKVAAKEPFLLHLSHFLVHTPITAVKEYVDHYEARLEGLRTDQDNVAYATMLRAMDDSVGAIIAKLEALGQMENTLILFTSDNGGFTGRGTTSNYPLMGGKSFSYEGAYRVPFIANWKGRIEAGRVSQTRVVGTDIYPTLLEAVGLELDPSQHTDGVSLLGEMTGGRWGSPVPERALFFHHPHYTHASAPHSIVLDGPYKLIRSYNDVEAGASLFNLDVDSSELLDLAAAQPGRVAHLSARLDAFLQSCGAELPVLAESAEGRRLIDLRAEGRA